MKFTSFINISAAALSVFMTYEFSKKEERTSYIKDKFVINDNSPPSLQMFYYIEKYSKEYSIPRDFAFGVANTESKYQGPLDWEYKYDVVGTSGEVGPMQIMYKYTEPFMDQKFTEDELKTNIELNVKTSFKILQFLYEKHKDWSLVFGAYNTGSPCVNQYSIKVTSYKPNY